MSAEKCQAMQKIFLYYKYDNMQDFKAQSGRDVIPVKREI